MKTFSQWLVEKQSRTGLGIYPSLYLVGQYPPLSLTPHSATAALALTTIHKKSRKKSKKHKKKD